MTPARRLRVLVIDDEPAIRSFLSDLLRFVLDADVDVAETGRAGLALFGENTYDLVLTDLLMPGMKGWEVAEMVRRLDPTVKVVVLTGSADHVEVQRAAKAGFTVLAKPIHVQDFKRAIEQVLGQRSPGLPQETKRAIG